MQLWAAIDILGGSVVTLRQGKESQKTSWKEGPLQSASRWEREGADGLHIIDLDAAFGRGSSKDVIRDIVDRAHIPVQVGGGVRSREAAEALLDWGVSRVILGTLAYAQPKILSVLLDDRGPEKFVVAADYSPEGKVMSKGWTSSVDISVFQAAKQLESAGVLTMLATSVGKDGTAKGPDVETTRRLCSSSKMRVLASGGIRDIDDLGELAKAGAAGAIIGRALYDGGIKLRVAKAELEGDLR
ncbi:MAG TPA: 1-(5-phosphoribosyl)-5-[(5-phosphoribosylamino)methylideneamino] imidazole-4-carboxamide isomerase [Nitrososphaerales archaeon]|nr:1-(5-phosphoribosyl)-5-[(5-phosphoribosylamino)methylideneamino] imidazole-4-carboxamide isomerase [Nitrososphaerales archaeon]